MHSYYSQMERSDGSGPTNHNYNYPTAYQQCPPTYLSKPKGNYWSSSNNNSIIPTHYQNDNYTRQRYPNPEQKSSTSYYNSQQYAAASHCSRFGGNPDSFSGLQQVFTSYVSGPTVLLVEPHAKKRWCTSIRFLSILLLVLCLLALAALGWMILKSGKPNATTFFFASQPKLNVQPNEVNKIKISMSIDDDSESVLENVYEP